MKKFVLAVTLILTFSSLPAFSATPPKPGSVCSKQGITKTYKGKKYTCIKSGKKLVWNKGFTIKQAMPVASPTPTPIPTPTPTPTKSNSESVFSVGILEQTYQGYFAENLDFFRQIPIQSIAVNKIDLREQYDGKKEFSKQWSGFFVPDSTGLWKFTITSDDSSHFWFGASAVSLNPLSKTVFGLPGVHAPMTKSQSFYLTQGKSYPFRIIWGNSINFAQMTLTVSAPSGVPRLDTELLFKHIASLNPMDGGTNLAALSPSALNSIDVSLEPYLAAPRDSTAQSIQNIIDEANKNGKDFAGSITWLFEGETSKEVESSTKKILSNGINLFSRLGFNTTNALVLNGQTSNWLKSQLRLLGCSFGELYDSPGGYYLPSKTCQGGHGAVTSPHWEWVRVNEKREDIEGIHFSHILPHEYFHQIQEELALGVGNGPYPLWLWEGGAHFFTLIAYANWNKERFYEQWSDYWFVEKEDPLKSGCKGVNVFYMRNNESGEKRFCGYSKGSVVTEYLVSKIGIMKYQSLIIEQAKNLNLQFPQIFEQVTGMKIEDFYTEADTFLKSRGWN